MNSTKDPFGFRFWLLWILAFAGSFLLAAGFWTAIYYFIFRQISEPELLTGWATAVFGCWFLLLTPFMRKKERIWKRLNTDQEKAMSAAFKALGLFIFALIASCLFWSLYFRDRIFSSPGLDTLWAKAVFGTWLFLILPFLVLMYRKADKILKDAEARQMEMGPKFRTAFVEKSKRMLPETVSKKIKGCAPVLQNGHVVSLQLKDGRKISDVFVMNNSEVLGVYDRSEMDFSASDILEAEIISPLPLYEESRWLRLDGRA